LVSSHPIAAPFILFLRYIYLYYITDILQYNKLNN